jgi:hypothetical protein
MTDLSEGVGIMANIVDNVSFEFYALTKRPFILMGTIDTTGNEMTLRVNLDGDDPYVVRGRSQSDGTFSGFHEGSEEDYPVEARWAKLGSRCVGTWDEADEHFIFAFSHPDTTP